MSTVESQGSPPDTQVMITVRSPGPAIMCMFMVLRASVLILRVLGIMGIFVMEKIMGLILAGFAVQLIYNGLLSLGIVRP